MQFGHASPLALFTPCLELTVVRLLSRNTASMRLLLGVALVEPGKGASGIYRLSNVLLCVATHSFAA